MIQILAEQLTLAAAKASGVSGNFSASLLQTWSIEDRRNGGIWNFRLLSTGKMPHVLNMAYQPVAGVEHDAFFLTVLWNGYEFDAAMDYRPELMTRGSAPYKAGLSLLDGTDGLDIHGRIHDALNDLFRRELREAYKRGCLEESIQNTPYVLDTEPKVELKDGAWEVDEQPRLTRLYQGRALDGQKDPRKLN